MLPGGRPSPADSRPADPTHPKASREARLTPAYRGVESQKIGDTQAPED